MRYFPNRWTLFDNDDFFEGFQSSNTAQMMDCDMKETENELQVMLNLPGCRKEDICMSLEDGYLNIEAVNNGSNEVQDEDGHWIRRERFMGTYQRSFYVGENLTENDIYASYKDGVLQIDIPKKEEIPARNIKLISID